MESTRFRQPWLPEAGRFHMLSSTKQPFCILRIVEYFLLFNAKILPKLLLFRKISCNVYHIHVFV